MNQYAFILLICTFQLFSTPAFAQATYTPNYSTDGWASGSIATPSTDISATGSPNSSVGTDNLNGSFASPFNPSQPDYQFGTRDSGDSSNNPYGTYSSIPSAGRAADNYYWSRVAGSSNIWRNSSLSPRGYEMPSVGNIYTGAPASFQSGW